MGVVNEIQSDLHDFDMTLDLQDLIDCAMHLVKVVISGRRYLLCSVRFALYACSIQVINLGDQNRLGLQSESRKVGDLFENVKIQSFEKYEILHMGNMDKCYEK